MKTYTVNQIRETLGQIMITILTPDFRATYAQDLQRDMEKIFQLMAKNWAATDSLVSSLALVLDSQPEMETLIAETPGSLLICFYMRYHLLTGFLVKQEQDKQLIMPESKEDFFKYLFTVFFHQSLFMPSI